MGASGADYEIVGMGDILVRWVVGEDRFRGYLGNLEEDLRRRITDEVADSAPGDTFLNLVEIKEDGDRIEVIGEFVNYGYFLASRAYPDLKEVIRPVGVSGMIILSEEEGEYTVFARRGEGVAQYAGYLELVPSGGVDKGCALGDGNVDYQVKLIRELYEECGIPPEAVEETTPLALVLDRGENVYDVCCLLKVSSDMDVVRAGLTAGWEYDQPIFVATSDLGFFTKKNHRMMVPTTLGIVEAYRRRIG